MSGDYYAGPNPLLKGTLNSVERERLRERDREARAQMTHEAEQRGSQDVVNSGPLFGEIVRVNPKSNDFERQQIERKLGKFDDVKHLLDQDVTNLFGIDGQPPPSPAPASNISKSSSSSSHEFKKPNMCSQSQQSRSSSHHHHHHHSSSQRGGFVKPADGKPPYSGRGFYPGQPMKHSSSSSNDFRGSGMVPVKGPPALNSSTMSTNNGSSANHHSNSSGRLTGMHEFSGGSGNKMHQGPRSSLPKLLCEPLDTLSSNTTSSGGSSNQANVENILDEMTQGVRTPLTAIAATPRKEMESKFTFNPVSGKMESLSPMKPSALDKNSKSNALNSILGPPGSRNPFLSGSVFKPGNIGNSFSSSSNSSISSPANSASASSKSSKSVSAASNGINDCANLATSGGGQNNVGHGSQSGSVGISPIASSVAAGLAKSTSVLPTLIKSDLSLSEDSEEEDENDENNDDSEEDNKTKKSVSNGTVQKPETAGSNKLESNSKPAMSPEEVRDSSSSDDSESDSGSESEDSSSDSPSPPPLASYVPPDPEDKKHKWNLKNFLPQSAQGNTTPALQIPQTCENDAKRKTESDMSGERARDDSYLCSSSSDSDESVKLRDKRKTSRTTNTTQSDFSSGDDCARRKYIRQSSSSCQSSDEGTKKSNKPSSKKVVHKSNISAGNTTGAGTNSSSCVVGVVKPHQRKPPSPQVFNRNQQPNSEERFAFVQRSSLQMSAAPEPQCELPVHSSNGDSVMGGLRDNRLPGSFQSQRAVSNVRNIKTTDKAVVPATTKTGGGKGRKPKSPATLSAGETPGKKKRGRKRTIKVPDLTDSEDDEPKVKVPERRKPGRPPLRRNESGDVDWNAGSRQLPRWGGRERRRTETRYSLTTDSDAEPLTATVKPTARVPPAIKKKEGGRSRDSSCESLKNDSDFTIPNATASRTSVTKAEESPPKLDVEGIAVQDKKKNDTLRKLFSRREEGGGKGGGKGKGGKGKCGVIVMESETERKMLERSLSPAPTLHRMHDHIAEISRVEISPPQSHLMNDRVPELSVIGSGGGGGGADSRSSISRRQDRVPDLNLGSVPNVMSSATASSSSSSIELPKLTYKENGKPSLMCKIDLAKIPYLFKKRSEEMRTKSELSDTRQSVDVVAAAPPILDLVPVPLIDPLLSSGDSADETTDRKRAGRKHCKNKNRSSKRKHHIVEESLTPVFTTTVHTPSVDPESDCLSSDSEHRKKLMCASNQRVSLRSTTEPMHAMMNSIYPMTVNNMTESGLCAEQEEESWVSCSSCSGSPMSCRGDKYGTHCKRMLKRHHADRKRRKTRNEHSQRHSSLMETTSPLLHVPGTNHERIPPEPSINGYMNVTDMVARPLVPTHHGIYYSYLEHKVSEEMNSESDSVSPNVYLMEAKRLKHAADSERDLVAQGMQYLEAILSFVLTGRVLERRSQIDTAFSMYSETLKLIVFISKKFRALCSNTAQSNIPNKIAILSLRCESILNLKLYTMRELEVKDTHNTVTEYFNKPIPSEAYLVANQGIPSPHSPTPSPASSVGSNSSGYSSGDRRTGGMAQCIAVPVNVHSALQKQHNFYSNLIASFNYWEEADKLIFSSGNKDFFIELDRFCGPLTLHSSLKDLVHYVRVGIQRLKAIISHHHRV